MKDLLNRYIINCNNILAEKIENKINGSFQLKQFWPNSYFVDINRRLLNLILICYHSINKYEIEIRPIKLSLLTNNFGWDYKSLSVPWQAQIKQLKH